MSIDVYPMFIDVHSMENMLTPFLHIDSKCFSIIKHHIILILDVLMFFKFTGTRLFLAIEIQQAHIAINCVAIVFSFQKIKRLVFSFNVTLLHVVYK